MEAKKEYRKQASLHIRVSPETRERLLRMCRDTNMSQSALIREWANKRVVHSHVNEVALSQLRQHMGLLKLCLKEFHAAGTKLSPDLQRKFEQTLDNIRGLCLAVVKAEGREES